MRVLVPVRGRVVTLLAVSAVALATATSAQAETVTPPFPTWVPDGAVDAVATDGDVAYIGGTFDSVGPDTGPAAVLSASTGEPQMPYTQIAAAAAGANPARTGGRVYASVPDGSGGYYIGGEFGEVEGVARTNLAHIEADGSVDPAFAPKPNGDVLALARSGSTLYVGGTFTSINSNSRSTVAAFSTATGKLTSWNPHATPALDQQLSVNALAAVGSTVYVGGEFDKIGGQSRHTLAAIDGATGKATSWHPDMGSSPYTYAQALAVSGPTVYIGGDFIDAGGQSRDSVAALDATTGAARAWNPDANGAVDALAVDGSTIWIGGDFTTIGGQPADDLAATDASTGALESSSPGANEPVLTLALSGSTLYAGGDFTDVGGQPRNHVAAIDSSTGMPTGWNPGADRFVQTLSPSGSAVFAGGIFDTVDGVGRDGLAAIDLSTGLPTSWAPVVSASDRNVLFDSIAIAGATVYVSGDFTQIGGQPRNGLAALDAATGTPTSWNPDPRDGAVGAMVADGETVFVGGRFSAIGGQARNNLAALDATTGTATAWNPTVGGTINSLVLAGSTIYAGGTFTMIDGQPRDGIGALDSATAAVTGWNPKATSAANGAASAEVASLSVLGSTVYAGGGFSQIGGQTRRGIAALSATTGEATAWNPSATTGQTQSPALVDTIVATPSAIYAGGYFNRIGGQARNYVASLSPTTGRATTWNPDPGSGVDAIALDGPDAVIAGSFGALGNDSQTGFAELPGV